LFSLIGIFKEKNISSTISEKLIPNLSCITKFLKDLQYRKNNNFGDLEGEMEGQAPEIEVSDLAFGL
jgi:hypothetical protein